tara:strand:- start:226 stop:426 length:201 start_codon:yes stop_codon:yes gene_type:complete
MKRHFIFSPTQSHKHAGMIFKNSSGAPVIVVDFSEALLLGQLKASNRLHKMGYSLDYQAAEGHCYT